MGEKDKGPTLGPLPLYGFLGWKAINLRDFALRDIEGNTWAKFVSRVWVVYMRRTKILMLLRCLSDELLASFWITLTSTRMGTVLLINQHSVRCGRRFFVHACFLSFRFNKRNTVQRIFFFFYCS